MAKNKRVLCIGDLHFPYHHPDTLRFLSAVKRKYKPDLVIQGGDEVDGHAWSFHEHDPDLYSPGDELAAAKEYVWKLFKIFPKMDLLESNHGSLYYRKQRNAGLPREIIKPYHEIYGVGSGWRWHKDMTVTLSNGAKVYLCHAKSADAVKVSMSMGMSVVQFHYHEKMGIQYWGNSLGLYFAAQAGCLIDDDALAYEYNKTNLKRPLIGSLIILDGLPKQLPMVLNKRGRWIGVVP